MTDEQIDAVITAGVRAGAISWLGYEKDAEGRYTLPVISISDRQAARAIEAAATAQLLERIAEQLRTIEVLNSAINGHGSTTTENLTLVGRLEVRIADLERRVKLTADRWQVECDNKDERIAELDRLLAQTSGMNELQRMRIAELERKSDQDDETIQWQANKLAQRVPDGWIARVLDE